MSSLAGERNTDGCSMRTLYRRFKEKVFDETTLPMKGKIKPNGHQECRGKQTFKKNIAEREKDSPNFKEEFGYIEGDTIVGIHHKIAVITLKPNVQKANDIENTMNQWFGLIPRYLFKSITFDCGKEFSNWKSLSNQHVIAFYFADPGTPSQRALKEQSNSLLLKDGLPKEMDLNQIEQAFVPSVANKRNTIPRKSLRYQTPSEVFLSYISEDILSSLI